MRVTNSPKRASSGETPVTKWLANELLRRGAGSAGDELGVGEILG